MRPVILSAAITTAGLVIVALITYRQNQRGAAATAAISERVVDREDFQTIVKELRESLAGVKADLEAEVEARKDADRRATEAERRAERAEQRATNLEARVTQLENVLREHDIPVPPPPSP